MTTTSNFIRTTVAVINPQTLSHTLQRTQGHLATAWLQTDPHLRLASKMRPSLQRRQHPYCPAEHTHDNKRDISIPHVAKGE